MFRNELEIMVKIGVLKEANNSEWGAPSFPQPKKKTNKIRFLSDFWNLDRQLKPTDSWYNNIPVSLRFDLDNLELKIFKIVLSLVGSSTITTLRVNKVTKFKRFRCNLLKTKNKIYGTW